MMTSENELKAGGVLPSVNTSALCKAQHKWVLSADKELVHCLTPKFLYFFFRYQFSVNEMCSQKPKPTHLRKI